MANLAVDLLEYLKEYHTEESIAIKAKELCTLFNLTSRQVRDIVSGLRQDGEAVCSSSSGYWYSTELEDVKKTLQRLEGQVTHMYKAIAGLRKAFSGELIGGDK